MHQNPTPVNSCAVVSCRTSAVQIAEPQLRFERALYAADECVGQPRRSTRSGDENAERVTRGIRQDVERLVRVIRSIYEELRSEGLSPLSLPLQLRPTRNREVKVHLHRDVMRGPGRPLEAFDLLERQFADTVRVREDEPVRVVSIAIPGWFVALAIAQSQELPIELGKSTGVGRVDGS